MQSSLGTNVGEIFYTVSLDTRKMVDEQRKVDRELKTTTGSLEQFGAKLNTITQAIKAYAAAMALIKVVQLADEIRMLGARVEVAAGSIKDGAAAFDDLVNISRRTQSSLEGNIEVFNRLNQSILQMGGTQADTLHITELLGKAIKVSGASATEAKAAMLQFGQALGSGKLQGDELRSLAETAPYLLQQIADGIGVPRGALKKLGEEGKLTADVVTNALTKAAAKIDEDFKKLPQTFEAALVVAQDQAALAALRFDELTGSSAALAGITKGAAEVLEKLAEQFANAAGEAEKLDRNGAVKSWAESSREALSYVVDAADVTWQTLSVLGRNVAFVFKGIGSEIGGIGAQIAAVMRGDFAGARAIGEEMKRDAEQRRKDLDAADAATLSRAQTMGEKMRQAWASGSASASGTGTAPSGKNLKAPITPEAAKKSTLDVVAYFAGLERAAVDGYDRINVVEETALQEARKKLTKESDFQRARTLIQQRAIGERLELARSELEALKKSSDENSKTVADMEKRIADERMRAVQFASQLTSAVNPIDALRQEYEAKLQLVTMYEQLMAQAGVDASTQGQITRTEIARQYEIQRQALAEQSFRSQGEAQAFLMDSLNSLSQTATSSIMGLINGTMSAQDAMRSLANTVLNEAVGALVQIGVQQIKNALTAKTLEAADKARAAAKGAVYAASVSAQVAGMTAMAAQNAFAATAAIPIIGPGLAPAAAATAGAAASALGAPAVATAPLAGARQYGGPVDAGSMYRVGEGNRPEMFVGDSGRSYMIPGERGKVIGNGDLGGGLVVNVEVVNNGASASPTVSGRLGSDGVAAIRVVLDAVADDLASGGKTARALQSRFNLRA